MRERNLVIGVIIVVIAIIGCVSAFYLSNNITYDNLTMSGIECEVPADNITPNVSNPNCQKYEDPNYNLSIAVYITNTGSNTTDNTTNDTNQTQTFQQQEQQFMEVINTANITPVKKDNVSYNKSSEGLYSYYVNDSGVNVMIKTTNENVLMHIIQTLHINPSIEVTLAENSTDNNTTTVTTKTVTKTTTSKQDHSDDNDNDTLTTNETTNNKNNNKNNNVDPSPEPYYPEPEYTYDWDW
ncbi:hypothetical protein [uncultured Methanosphaera sp.]|uniref:hypothetical protein n=1 Tax=uncultured Methanosphaera sp. TaxID=262501 RepID=UPI002805E14E|nr:hypothetical protein [uncultured Methanosphaera sp.]